MDEEERQNLNYSFSSPAYISSQEAVGVPKHDVPQDELPEHEKHSGRWVHVERIVQLGQQELTIAIWMSRGGTITNKSVKLRAHMYVVGP